ncbi:hypothetical protein ACWD0A_31550 [Streptomyces sp. NPDC002867]
MAGGFRSCRQFFGFVGSAVAVVLVAVLTEGRLRLALLWIIIPLLVAALSYLDFRQARKERSKFRQAQEQELARDNCGFEGRTIDELWQDEEWKEYILTGGTGTVLDLVHMVDPAFTEWGPFMRPLTVGEVWAWAPSGRPTRAEWIDALETERLPYPGRACGNCTMLYRDCLAHGDRLLGCHRRLW